MWVGDGTGVGRWAGGGGGRGQVEGLLGSCREEDRRFREQAYGSQLPGLCEAIMTITLLRRQKKDLTIVKCSCEGHASWSKGRSRV